MPLKTTYATGDPMPAADMNATNTAVNGASQVKPRVNVIASAAAPTIDVGSYDLISITALNTAITSMSSGISGSPGDGQSLLVRIKDNGTARAITWGASWRAVGVTLPTATVAGKVHYVGAKYNSADSVWDAIAVGQQA